jgi:hypothetical protein
MLNVQRPAPSSLVSGSDSGARKSLLVTTGIQQLFGYLSQALLPQPLPGRYASFYGFNSAFERFLQENSGSAIDPAVARLNRLEQHSFTISEEFSRSAAEFRKLIPARSKLLLALSPIPESNATLDISLQQESLLLELADLLKPDGTLRLPATLPDALFSTATHLRPEYRARYTRLLYAEFQRTITATADQPESLHR